ncbi:MAG: hypothetical protein KC478_00485, partial [Bacteriovoracaceae bacterium]|nr:hypothetical protein [Bacteriovoracaceae bacterium]
QSFISGVIEKIKKAQEIKKTSGLNFHIQVDGGVNNQNAPTLIKAGATMLVAGSYIFGTEQSDYLNRVESLR